LQAIVFAGLKISAKILDFWHSPPSLLSYKTNNTRANQPQDGWPGATRPEGGTPQAAQAGVLALR
jgi:hypothetical protein